MNFMSPLQQIFIRIRYRCDERGASLVEYALLLALIALVLITAVTTLGETVSDSLYNAESEIFG